MPPPGGLPHRAASFFFGVFWRSWLPVSAARHGGCVLDRGADHLVGSMMPLVTQMAVFPVWCRSRRRTDPFPGSCRDDGAPRPRLIGSGGPRGERLAHDLDPLLLFVVLVLMPLSLLGSPIRATPPPGTCLPRRAALGRNASRHHVRSLRSFTSPGSVAARPTVITATPPASFSILSCNLLTCRSRGGFRRSALDLRHALAISASYLAAPGR